MVKWIVTERTNIFLFIGVGLLSLALIRYFFGVDTLRIVSITLIGVGLILTLFYKWEVINGD